jgi:hypothetical protein
MTSVATPINALRRVRRTRRDYGRTLSDRIRRNPRRKRSYHLLAIPCPQGRGDRIAAEGLRRYDACSRRTQGIRRAIVTASGLIEQA